MGVISPKTPTAKRIPKKPTLIRVKKKSRGLVIKAGGTFLNITCSSRQRLLPFQSTGVTISSTFDFNIFGIMLLTIYRDNLLSFFRNEIRGICPKD